MELTGKLLTELQNRLKVGNRRGVHLNAIPGRSRYKFDLNRLSHLDEKLPQEFINALLTGRARALPARAVRGYALLRPTLAGLCLPLGGPVHTTALGNTCRHRTGKRRSALAGTPGHDT